MTIQQATPADQAWVNHQYNSINFLPSDVNVDYVTIAFIDGQRAGLGRLVPIANNCWEMGGMYVLPEFRKRGVAGEIVAHLIEKKAEYEGVLWCIPFRHLVSFYARYGFEEIEPTKVDIPQKILEKHNWCDSHYDKGVAFMLLKVSQKM